MDNDNSPTKRQIANGCRHFNGIQHDTCEAGVSYKQYLYENFPNFPCHPRVDGTESKVCPTFAYSSETEIDAEEKEMYAAAAASLKAMFSGKCPECGAKVEHKRQVGRCVYADPCGHRLYQGDVSSKLGG